MKPRRWFQFQLTTLLILMLAAAAFVGLNVTQHSFRFNHQDYSWMADFMEYKEYGWPFACIERIQNEGGWEIGKTSKGETFNIRYPKPDPTWHFKPLPLCLNVIAAIITSATILALSEFLLRRR